MREENGGTKGDDPPQWCVSYLGNGRNNKKNGKEMEDDMTRLVEKFSILSASKQSARISSSGVSSRYSR